MVTDDERSTAKQIAQDKAKKRSAQKTQASKTNDKEVDTDREDAHTPPFETNQHTPESTSSLQNPVAARDSDTKTPHSIGFFQYN